MILARAGIIFIWAADIVSGKFSDQGNFLRWKEGENYYDKAFIQLSHPIY